MSSDFPRAVVLVLDGLGAGYLGPYGNTWIETPTFNQLASQSWLLEQALIDSPNLELLYRSLWTGRHAARPAPPDSPPAASLLQRLAQAGASTLLITDEAACAQHPLAQAFERTQWVAAEDVAEPVTCAEDTSFARLMAAAIEALADELPPLTWIHARAMQAPWDAPLEFRQQFLEEDDPDPPETAVPPRLVLPTDYDPDLLQGWLWAYAGQVMLLDLCLQPLVAMLDRLQPPPLLILMGARGYPLGEHGAIGSAVDRLYSELIHVPLLVRAPAWNVAALRSQPLMQPPHVHGALCHWFGVEPEVGPTHQLGELLDETTVQHELAVCLDSGQWVLRTPNWLARLTGSCPDPSRDAAALECQLFLKPDDRWDVNDVADRCPEITHGFRGLLQQLWAIRHQPSWPDCMVVPDSIRERP